MTITYQLSFQAHQLTKEEFNQAIKLVKNGEASCLDDVSVEILKLLGDNRISVLTEMFNIVYDKGIIPTDWLKSTFVMIPKKIKAVKCRISIYKLNEPRLKNILESNTW